MKARARSIKDEREAFGRLNVVKNTTRVAEEKMTDAAATLDKLANLEHAAVLFDSDERAELQTLAVQLGAMVARLSAKRAI